MDIDGSSALVTGGSSGVGLATARLLTAGGAHCVLVGRDVAKGTRAAADIGADFVAADVTDEAAIGSAIGRACELGPLRVAVHSAGIGQNSRLVKRDNQPLSLAAFRSVIEVNLIGAFNVLRLCAAAMAEQPPVSPDGSRGAVVMVSSVAAFDGRAGQVAYASSKSGVVGMTLPSARDLAPIGVRVNTVAPGLVDTPMFGDGPAAEDRKAELAAAVPFPRRLGSSEEVASMIFQLLVNDYVNGEVVRIDGGIRLGDI